MVGILVLFYIPLPIYITIPVAVGAGVCLMIILNVTHPPAGGNPIIVIIGSVSIDYLINPIITGTIIIFNFWNNFKSTNLKKEISYLDGYKI